MSLNRERVSVTPALILRRSEYGEADYLVTLFTPQEGKIRALAKGARKPLSRYVGQLELYSQAHLVINRGRELHIISQATAEQVFPLLQNNLERSISASVMVELLDQFSPDEEPNRAAYQLLLEAWGWLSEGETPPDLCLRYYEYRLLRVMGYEPSLFECPISGETLTPQDLFFCPAEGGVVSQRHILGLEGLWLTLPVFKILRHFSRQPWEVVRTLRLEEGQMRLLERALHTYLTYLLERKLKSLSVLHQVPKENPAHD